MVPSSPIYRFAPSPNGYLHLGHAYSALLNFDQAQRSGGTMLLRIEDIDTTRCRPEFTAAIEEDLAWLGLSWQRPVLHQTSRMSAYRAALSQLEARGLLYPCFCTRSQLHNAQRDPNGAPLYHGACKHLDSAQRAERRSREAYALRLDCETALQDTQPLFWNEGHLPQRATPQIWGDVILARKDIGTSYHLAVVLDDAAQQISHVLRGQDLLQATHLHRLLQHLLALPTPAYQHHALLKDDKGEKLSKSHVSKPLRQWRAEGATPASLRALLGLTAP